MGALICSNYVCAENRRTWFACLGDDLRYFQNRKRFLFHQLEFWLKLGWLLGRLIFEIQIECWKSHLWWSIRLRMSFDSRDRIFLRDQIRLQAIKMINFALLCDGAASFERIFRSLIWNNIRNKDFVFLSKPLLLLFQDFLWAFFWLLVIEVCGSLLPPVDSLSIINTLISLTFSCALTQGFFQLVMLIIS
jgi:hypothetical protein